MLASISKLGEKPGRQQLVEKLAAQSATPKTIKGVHHSYRSEYMFTSHLTLLNIDNNAPTVTINCR